MLAQQIHRLDAWLLDERPSALEGPARWLMEFWRFGIKQARACIFAGAFFAAVFLTHEFRLPWIPRYDLLLLIAIVLQAWLLRHGFETWDEFKAIMAFHVVGFALEAFKTSASVQSWAYPEFAYSKVLGVPLFSGFMYSAVGSYVIQAWRLMNVRIIRAPPHWMAGLLATLIYLNFFTHHFVMDIRGYLAAAALGLHANALVLYQPMDRDRRMPLLLAWVLIGFFLWLAENISTFFALWQYPDQVSRWARVGFGKWGAWTLLVMMTFYLVSWLKHIKERIRVIA